MKQIRRRAYSERDNWTDEEWEKAKERWTKEAEAIYRNRRRTDHIRRLIDKLARHPKLLRTDF